MNSDDQNSYRRMVQTLAMVTQIFLMSLIGFAAGWGLEKVLAGVKPWLSISFTFLGMIMGFVRLYKWYAKDADTQ